MAQRGAVVLTLHNPATFTSRAVRFWAAAMAPGGQVGSATGEAGAGAGGAGAMAGAAGAGLRPASPLIGR